MFVRNFQLFLMAFWLLIGLGLLFRGWVMPNAQFGPIGGGSADLGGYFAIGLAVWNFARWTLARNVEKNREAMARRPLAPRPTYPDEGRPIKPDYNPEFDFLKPPGLDQPTPSANGDHK